MWPFRLKTTEPALQPTPPEKVMRPTLNFRWKDGVLQQFWVRLPIGGFVTDALHCRESHCTDDNGRWENIPKESSP